MPASPNHPEQSDSQGSRFKRKTDWSSPEWVHHRSFSPTGFSEPTGLIPAQRLRWKVFPPGELGLALSKGEVDAVADAEPIGTLLIAQGKARNVEGMDEATDEPYANEYCCEIIGNGKWIDANPDSAARATRAILRGAVWVQQNPKAAAQLAVDKKYLASTVELNTVAISRLKVHSVCH